MAVAGALAVWTAGCTKDNPNFCSSDEDCTTGAFPVCDLTGEIGGTANECVAASIDAGQPGGDAGTDGGGTVDPPEQTTLLAPAYGAFTGSVFSDAALRPRFLWNATARAGRYELQVDDSCDVIEFATCEFPSPEIDETDIASTEHRPALVLPVSTDAPVGRRYYWRVRACNSAGCGDYSDVRYLNVGRQATDYNGDGYGDRIVGMRSRTAGRVGRAYLYFGGSDAAPATIAASDVTLEDPRNEADGLYGELVLSVGDVDADGFGDVVVGAPSHDRLEPDAGVGYLYLGRASWPASLSAADTELVNPDANGAMGAPIRDGYARAGCGGGDINGDGFSDFSLAAFPDVTPTMPPVQYVHFGRPAWPALTISFDVSLPDPSSTPESAFGFASDCRGDVNGDGRADIVVGAGRAYVYFGRASFDASPATLEEPDDALMNPGTDLADLFGLAISNAGDVDGDGIADIAVGAPGRTAPELSEGGLFLFLGTTGAPLPASPATTFDNPTDTVLGTFGIAVDTSGDLDGDGIADIAVGHSFRDGAGDVFLYFGRVDWPGGVIAAGARLLNSFTDEGAALGNAVATSGDWNGDGLADVAGASKNASNPEAGEGAALFWLGRATWPTTVDVPDSVVDNPSDTTDDHFGDSLN